VAGQNRPLKLRGPAQPGGHAEGHALGSGLPVIAEWKWLSQVSDLPFEMAGTGATWRSR
jgi:hypothetical protein